VFSNSQVVSDRLAALQRHSRASRFFRLIFHPERFHHRAMNDEIVCICRLEAPQASTSADRGAEILQRTPVKLELCGLSGSADYSGGTAATGPRPRRRRQASSIDHRWITEDEKADSPCRLPGRRLYPQSTRTRTAIPRIEAAHASQACCSRRRTPAGTLEFVLHEVNGLDHPCPKPQALALTRWTDSTKTAPRRSAWAERQMLGSKS
jgi:hypothetical protein